MERISPTPRANTSNYYSQRKQTIKGYSSHFDNIDSLAFKRYLDEEVSIRAKQSEKETAEQARFKSLVESASRKMNAQPTRSSSINESYKSIADQMMSESIATKMHVHKSTTSEIDELRKSRQMSSTPAQRVEYVYKNNSNYRGYKQNIGYSKRDFDSYSKSTVDSKSVQSTALQKQTTTKISFWERFKNKIKEFFGVDKDKTEISSVRNIQPTQNSFKQEVKVPKQDMNAPQISYQILEDAKKSRRQLWQEESKSKAR